MNGRRFPAGVDLNNDCPDITRRAREYAEHNKHLTNDREREIAVEAYRTAYYHAVRRIECMAIYSQKNILEQIKEIKNG